MPYSGTLLILLTILGSLLSVGIVNAQTYGSQLITPEERAAHRNTMRSLPPAEREAYRAKRHEEMKKRAEEAGMSLPDKPPARGMGQGRGYGGGLDRSHRWGRGAYGPRRFGYGSRHGDFGPRGPGYGWGRRGAGPWGPGYGRGHGGYVPWGSGCGQPWY